MPAPAERFEVVIVGAGLTGATLALALAQAGMAVAVVDALPLDARLEPVFDGRASAVAYANMRQFRVLGLAHALTTDAQPITSILVTDGPAPGASGRAPLPVFLRFDPAEIAESAGEPLGWMVENRRLRAALAGALDQAGVAVFAPAQVGEIALDGPAAHVRLADGRTLVAPLAVGAEGRRSAVREAARIGVNGWDYRQAGVVATVALERPHGGVAHEHFLPGGPLAILPLTPLGGQNRASLVWTERPGPARALVEASVEAFEATLARRFGDFLGAPRLVGPRFGYPLGLQIAECMVAPRAALVGDAAHAVHPIAGQGLNLGLKDVAALAEVVVEARRLGEDWGGALVLERYARWRRLDSIGLALATDLFTRLFSTDDPLTRLVRGAGLAAVNRIAPARRMFMRESGGALGDLPRLLRGEAL